MKEDERSRFLIIIVGFSLSRLGLCVVQVSPDVLALYNIIETNFRPMSIVKDSLPHLATIAKESEEVAR